MSNDIFIGVDGGGTQCKVRVVDDQDNLLGYAVGGPANIRLSVPTSWNSINTALAKALEPTAISLNDPKYRFHIGLGLAGCEVKEDCEDFLSRPHKFTTICLNSDAYTACLGAHEGKDGAIIIIGTGVVGMQIFGAETAKVGGWGFPHSDEGGGAWLGLESMRKTLHWVDKRQEETPMLKAILQRFENNLNQMVTWANRAASTQFAELAPLVLDYVKAKDPCALQLIQQAARAIDEVGAALAKATPNRKPLPCCFFGSVAPFIEPWIGDALRARLVPRKQDANAGAILMVREFLKKR